MLSKSPGFLSPDRRCLTGNTLKCVGIVTMTIDHLAAVVLKGFVNSHIGLFSEKQLADLDLLYQYMRHIGRTAFPLFVFLLVEGFFHTKDRKGYGLRLLLFAILSEIPYNLAVYGRISYPKTQNTLFLLFLGLVLMAAAERIRGRWVFVRFLLFVAGGGLAYLLGLDYTYKGIALVGIFYFFYGYRMAAALGGFCVFLSSPWSFPAFLMIPFYNGRRCRRRMGWLYLFYPVHLLVLYGILQLSLCIF